MYSGGGRRKYSSSLESLKKEICGDRIIKIVLDRIKQKSGSSSVYEDQTEKDVRKSEPRCKIKAIPRKSRFVENSSGDSSVFSSGQKGSDNDCETIEEDPGSTQRRSLRHRKVPSRFLSYKTTSYIDASTDDDSDTEQIHPSSSKRKSKKRKLLSKTRKSKHQDPDSDYDSNQNKNKPKEQTSTLVCCDLCSSQFKSVHRLEEHILRFHVMDKPFECEICFKSFITKEKLEKHTKKHRLTSKSIYQCKMCKVGSLTGPKSVWKYFKSKSELKIHYDTMHSSFSNNFDESRHPCPLCKTTFLSDLDFQSHLKRNDSVAIKCSLCLLLVDTQCLLTQHRRREHKCYDNESVNVNINNDTRSQGNEIEFKCLVCKSTFSRRTDLSLHEIAEKHTRWKCPLCSKLMKTNKGLMDHLSSIHSDARPYKCKHCDKNFTTARNMRYHSVIHSKDPKVLAQHTCQVPDCQFFEKFFLKKIELVQHNANHHGGEKKHECPKCSKRWATPADLRQHLFSHSDYRGFKCPYCDAGYKKLSERNRHMKNRCPVAKDLAQSCEASPGPSDDFPNEQEKNRNGKTVKTSSRKRVGVRSNEETNGNNLEMETIVKIMKEESRTYEEDQDVKLIKEEMVVGYSI